MTPALWARVGELVEAYGAIKRLGFEAWHAARGRPELDERLAERLAALDAELDRLEFEDDVAEALAEARRRGT